MNLITMSLFILSTLILIGYYILIIVGLFYHETKDR